ncbi:MAG: sugar phosphate isomerase/epimerase [Planctomycetaceae bacterium]|nr:sugar phosphate isomerase/epimerase [Planctomycetaceae bacterium]MCP4815566.1 sugar phosphate isomerase/epimerase [Planctomycetaceae bacterium]
MQLSLFSISYAGFWGQDVLELPAFLSRAASLGYETVMLAGKRPHLSPLDMNEEAILELRKELEANAISCSVLAAYTDLSPPRAAEVPYLEMQVAYVESLAQIAQAVGASIVRVFTAYEVDGHGPASIWTNVVRSLQEMCDRAAAHDVTVAVQNHHDIGVHTDALLELLHDIDRPNCKLGADAWSPALRGEDLHEAGLKMAPHAAITTNADYVRLPRYHYQPELINYQRAEPDMVRAVKFGEGFIDYEAFFQGLVEGGFNGVANYEMCSPVRGGGAMSNLDDYARTYVTWMQENVSP